MQVVDIEPSNNEQIEEYIPPLQTGKKIKNLMKEQNVIYVIKK